MKKNIILSLFLLYFFNGLIVITFAQENDTADKSISDYFLSVWGSTAIIFATGDRIPLLLDNGVRGIIVDPNKPITGINLFFDSPLFNNNAEFHFVSNVYQRIDPETPILLTPELYAQIQFGNILKIAMGKYPISVGLNPGGLSSGSLILSGTGPAYPALYVGTPDFVDIPFTSGILQIRFHFSYGTLDDERYVRNSLIQSKSLYGRLKLPFDFSLSCGLVHAVLWGGSSPVYGDLPSSFDDFCKAFFAVYGGEDSPENEQMNRQGDHKGMWDYGLEKEFGSFTVKAYYQHFFEDNSGMLYWNDGITDGLWGVAITIKKPGIVTSICYEYYNSTNQSGTGAHNETGGQDYYYENSIYRTGWTYEGIPLGTPFIITSGSGTSVDYIHTRARVHYVSFQGFLTNRIGYNCYLAFQRYFGTYADYNSDTGGNEVFKDGLPQTSVALYFNFDRLFNTCGLQGSLGLGFDFGEARDDSSALRVSIQYRIR